MNINIFMFLKTHNMETIELTHTWKIIFCIVAVIHTALFTIYAFKIHSIPKSLIDNYKRDKNFAWVIYQYFFNFIGAAFAWFLLWILLPTYISAFCNQKVSLLTTKVIILSLIVLLGLVGYIPLTLHGIAKSFIELAKKISGKE